ncbi:unnamed protein product [Sphagnum troendelagicum]
MPLLLHNYVHILSDTGLGMAMFSLGLFMGLQERLIVCGWPPAIYGMVLCFLFGPGAFAAALYLVGLTGVGLNVAIMQAALPQRIAPFVFAKEYNVHPDILSTAPLEEELHGRCPQAAEMGLCCQPQICQPSCLAPILTWSPSNPNSLEYVFFFGPNGCSPRCAPQDWRCLLWCICELSPQH